MCVSQSNKLSKLESERQEWQRRIIETEREKRVKRFSFEKESKNDFHSKKK